METTREILSNRSLPISKALEVFLRGFSITRSFHKPFASRLIGPAIWLMADAPESKGSERASEVIVYGAAPEDVREAVASLKLERYFLCILLDDVSDAAETSATYKQRGYRRLGNEPLFVVNTAERVHFDTFPVRRVLTPADAEAVAKAARSRQIFPQHLTQEDAVCRLYAAFEGDTPIGWVRSIRTHPDCAWVSNLFVHPAHRRKGIGRTLMSTMLEDDARHGVEWSVLLASQTGAKLYPHLGYVGRGLLLLFSPVKPKIKI